MADVAAQIIRIVPQYVGADAAIYLVEKKNDAGQRYVHTVVFKKQSDGRWAISEM